MRPVGLYALEPNLAGAEPAFQLTIVAKQTIIFAASDPEQFHFCGLGWIQVGKHCPWIIKNGCTHGSNPGEGLEMVEADVERFCSAHGKSRNSTRIAVCLHRVILL